MRRCLALLLVAVASILGGCTDDEPDAPPRDHAAPAASSPLPPSETTETPATTAGTPSASPPTFLGVRSQPLQIGAERPLPDGVAVLVVTGCWQCDGPATGIVRVYRDAAGVTHTDTLLQRTEGAQNQPYISGVAAAPDASDIAVSICTRGYCGALNAITSDARTSVLRSRDGGVTWAELADLDGAYSVDALDRHGIILSGPYPARDAAAPPAAPTFWRYPGRQPVIPPLGAERGRPVVLAGGDLGWRSDDGRRLLATDGRVILRLDLGEHSAGITPAPDGERFAVSWWDVPPGQPPSTGRYYLGILGADDRLRSVFASDGVVRAGVWLDDRSVLGNVSVTAAQLTTPPPEPFLGYVPALIDLESGRAEPIVEGFGAGRNQIRAVMRGPFARVRGTGDCLAVRAAPRRDAPAMACVADNVLLRDLNEMHAGAGDRWLKVATPAGIEGWSNAGYLER
jgi:hypothetical protein